MFNEEYATEYQKALKDLHDAGKAAFAAENEADGQAVPGKLQILTDKEAELNEAHQAAWEHFNEIGAKYFGLKE